MPTPFMHLALAQRLIADPDLPRRAYDAICAGWGAFLLGSIAPDARISSGAARANTHFFQYEPVVKPPAVIAMLRQYPDLRRSALGDQARLAFLAGYVAHLAMDQAWCTEMLFPYFVRVEWGDRPRRMLVFHILLGYLDARDRAVLPHNQYMALAAAAPHGWLPFISDSDLAAWRDLVAGQITPGGSSRTLEILGKVVGLPPDDLGRRIERDMAQVWEHITPTQVAAVEQAMYSAVREALVYYIDDRITTQLEK